MLTGFCYFSRPKLNFHDPHTQIQDSQDPHTQFPDILQALISQIKIPCFSRIPDCITIQYCKGMSIHTDNLTFFPCHSTMCDTMPSARGWSVSLSITLLISQGKLHCWASFTNLSTPKSEKNGLLCLRTLYHKQFI